MRLRSTVADTKTITASFGNPVQSITATVAFTAGTPVLAKSELPISGPVVADDAATSTIAATLRDVFQNPVPGVAVAFTASGTGNTQSSASATTDPSGVATIALKSSKAETKNVTASFGSPAATLSGSVTFVPGPPSAQRSSLEVSPPSLVADGAATCSILATFRDAHDNPLPGVPVSFAFTGSANETTAGAATDASGRATATLRST